MLGRGATSVVYLAEKTGSGKRYAVKVSICDREKLRREAFLLQKFSYPGIPCAVELLESGTKSFLVMEAVNGKSIGQRMRKGERFSSREILKTGIALSGILCYLHAQNPPVFYRDLKPDNVMITERGEIYLVDFGAAGTEETGVEVRYGTRGYAAPEQYNGKCDARSDLYALGALLAAPLAFLSTPKLLPRPVALLFRVLIVAIRSVPFLIYGLIFIRVSGPGAFTGVLTLAVCSIGLLSKRFTEAIESLDFRAYDALRAMGVSLLPRIRYAVLPQLGPAFSSAVLYRFDVNIREASVLGLVGAGGIGAPLIFAMNQYAWNDVSAIFLGFVLLVWLIDVGSARLRTRRTAAAAPGK